MHCVNHNSNIIGSEIEIRVCNFLFVYYTKIKISLYNKNVKKSKYDFI